MKNDNHFAKYYNSISTSWKWGIDELESLNYKKGVPINIGR